MLLILVTYSGCSRVASHGETPMERSSPKSGDWIHQLELLRPGIATRGDVEALLPLGCNRAPGFGGGGRHNEWYVISNLWQVAVVYDSPDMSYVPKRGQLLLEGPYISLLTPGSPGSLGVNRTSTLPLFK